jgi:hypothetical protein
VPTRRETRSQERGGGQDDVAVIGKLWIVSSATLVHTETTARYPEHRLHMTSVGRLSSPSAPATTPEAGVLTVDRVSPKPPDTRSTVLISWPIGAGNRLPHRRYGPQHSTETSRQATLTRQTRNPLNRPPGKIKEQRSRLGTPSRPSPARPGDILWDGNLPRSISRPSDVG